MRKELLAAFENIHSSPYIIILQRSSVVSKNNINNIYIIYAIMVCISMCASSNWWRILFLEKVFKNMVTGVIFT